EDDQVAEAAAVDLVRITPGGAQERRCGIEPGIRTDEPQLPVQPVAPARPLIELELVWSVELSAAHDVRPVVARHGPEQLRPLPALVRRPTDGILKHGLARIASQGRIRGPRPEGWDRRRVNAAVVSERSALLGRRAHGSDARRRD